MIDRHEATSLAKKLIALSPHIIKIQLIGSVQQKGVGNDVDYVVIVPDDIAREWWSTHGVDIKVRWPDFLYKYRWIIKKFALFAYDETIKRKKRHRLNGAAELLNIDFADIASEPELPDFEMFLLPQGWQRENKLQPEVVFKATTLVDHVNTRGFLERIARDAEVIATS